VEYRVLGPIEVAAGGTLVPVTAGKQRELLALLLINANSPVSSDVLIDGLWGERPPATVAKNLHVLVSQLRKALGEGAIATVPGGYQLAVADGATDVERYETLLERGRRELADGRPREAQRTLEDALALWRGRAFEDVVYEDFARAEVERLEERRLIGVEERFEAVLANGRHADAVPDLERFASEQPLRERPAELLMLALYRSGRQAEALAAYDRVRRRLSDELGIEPGQAIRELHEQILRQDPALGATDRRPAMRPTPRRRGRLLLIAGAALVILAAVLAAVVAARSSDSQALPQISPDAVGVLDPGTGKLVAQYAVGPTPTQVVTAGDVAWSLNADGSTISRIDLTGATPTSTRGVPTGAPVSILYARNRLWVAVVHRKLSGPLIGSLTAQVIRMDPDTLTADRGSIVNLPGLGGGDVPMTYGMGKLWAGTVDGEVVRIDPDSLQYQVQVSQAYATALATGLGKVWVTTAATGRTPPSVRAVDPDAKWGGKPIPVATPALDSVAVAQDAVWAADPTTGNVWKINPGPPTQLTSVHIGGGVFALAVHHGTLWATSGVNGTVTRITPTPDAVRLRRYVIGNTPAGVAVSSHGVLVTVSGGGGGAPVASKAGSGFASLSASKCGAVLQGIRPPEKLIVSDLPTSEQNAANTLPMVQAMIAELRKHDFTAGRFALGFQSCNDADPSNGDWSGPACVANADSYAATSTVVGVIGTYNSGCALAELPVLETAPGGPLPLVSPTNAAIGLTHPLKGKAGTDYRLAHPNGKPAMVRVYPGDDVQAVAEVEMARRLGLKRVAVLVDHSHYAGYPDFEIGSVLPDAAQQRGIAVVVGPVWPGQHNVTKLVDQMIRAHVDGILLAGDTYKGSPMVHVVRALRRSDPKLPVIADDGFLPSSNALYMFGKAGDGMYITSGYLTDPAVELPAAGAQWVRKFSATQQGRIVTTYTPNAAQATDVLISAIAHSDGTRASVMSELLRTRVYNGILGSFGFDQNGDMTSQEIGIIRADYNRPWRLPDHVETDLRGLRGVTF